MSADVQSYFWIALGVLVAVVFPILRAYVTNEYGKIAGPGIPVWLKTYLGLFAFCLVTALICLAGWKSQNPDASLAWFQAFLMGFAWESAVEKIGRP